MLDFEGILKTIAVGKTVATDDLLFFLCKDSKKDRLSANFKLAEAFYSAGKIEQAKVFIQRAWLFSGFSEEVLPLLEKVCRAVDDLDTLREAYKRVGLNKARSGGVEAALPYFMKNMYIHSNHGKGDTYSYDFDILHELECLAEPFRFSPALHEWAPGVRKLRVAYLVYGATTNQSVIVRILRSIGQHHDRERFEFAFFIPENELTEFSGSAFLRENIRSLEQLGEIVVVTNGTSHVEALLDTGRQIFEYAPDILVTSVLLGDLKQYYIASLRPAPVTIGFMFGPPQQFSAPLLDWSIAYDPHALMDCMSNCTRISSETELPPKDGPRVSRAKYGIPDEAVVIVASGRFSKFLDRDYWENIAEVMKEDSRAYLIVVGLTKRPLFLDEIIAGELVGRTVILGWVDDLNAIFRASDIMVDTYPSGGGATIHDAMGLGIPVLTFKNNYMHLFDQTDWSVGGWLVEISDLVLERGDWSQMRTTLTRLVSDREYRMEMGMLCRQRAVDKWSSPERMIRNMENVYQDVFQKIYDSRSVSVAPLSPGLPDTAVFREVMEKRINFWRFQEEFIQRDAVHFAAFFTRFPFLVSILLKLESVIKPSYVKRLTSYLKR